MHGAFAFEHVSNLLDSLAMGLFAIAPGSIRNTFTQTFIAPTVSARPAPYAKPAEPFRLQSFVE